MLRFILTTILLIVVGAFGFLAWVWHDLHTKVDYSGGDQAFEVVRGESVDEILRSLQSRKIVSNIFPLRLYLKAMREEPMIKAGTYSFPSPMSPLDVLDQLKRGGEFGRLTVIEGWTRFEIADAMMRVPSLKLTSREQALRLFDQVSLIKDIDPKCKNLEGYLFPDTYFIVSDTSPKELVKDMVQRFREVWNNGLKQQATSNHTDAHRAVTAASIIETEAKLKSERPIVASVVENRLKVKMPLSMDSTLVYAAKLAGTWKNDGKVYQSDIDRASPYNTRKNKGLPPGPIASPGLSSLQAAVNPAGTKFLFYVRNPDRTDGAHNFYADAQSFEVGVQALRQWEAKHPARTR